VSTEPQLHHSEASTVAAILAIGTLGVAVLLVLPGLVGVLKQGYGFNDSQLGYLSSADLGGLTLGSALGARFVPNVGIRRGALGGLLVAAIANAATVLSSAFWPLLTLRIVAGLGAGLAVAVCYIVLGRS
jgi:MFS family permease